MRMTLMGHEAQLEGLAMCLRGGQLCLYTMRPPASADGVLPANTDVLAELPITEVAQEGGALRLSLRGQGMRAGVATWFRVLDHRQEPLLDGTVGRTGGDLILPMNTVQPGARIEIVAVIGSEA